MSKARLIITAVIIQGRSQSEVARDYSVSKGWVSKLVARYRVEGSTAFEARSRRPHTTPGAIPEGTRELIGALRDELTGRGLDAGAHILILVDDLNVTIINATTGELLRTLTINPSRDYQPQNTRKPPKP